MTIKNGELHPLLKMKQERDKVRKRGVGIVFSNEGEPRISPDWVSSLTADERAWADAQLAERGYRLTADNSWEKI